MRPRVVPLVFLLQNTGVEGGETAIKLARRWGYDVKGVEDVSPPVSFPRVLCLASVVRICSLNGAADGRTYYYDSSVPSTGLW